MGTSAALRCPAALPGASRRACTPAAAFQPRGTMTSGRTARPGPRSCVGHAQGRGSLAAGVPKRRRYAPFPSCSTDAGAAAVTGTGTGFARWDQSGCCRTSGHTRRSRTRGRRNWNLRAHQSPGKTVARLAWRHLMLRLSRKADRAQVASLLVPALSQENPHRTKESGFP